MGICTNKCSCHRGNISWPKKPTFSPPGGPPGPPIQWGDDITNDNADLGFGYLGGGLEEKDSYFYHSDHLGSTSYLTDLKGNVRQYTAYMPYGESFVSEHTTSTELPYLFNGKPLDEETGLYYYGARYFTPSEAVWHGVDLLWEKYPNIGGYVYCVSNPIKYIDPNGKQPKPKISTKIYDSYDKTRNIETYNCAGLATRTYKQMNLNGYYDHNNKYQEGLIDYLKANGGYEGEKGKPYEIQYTIWEYVYILNTEMVLNGDHHKIFML